MDVSYLLLMQLTWVSKLIAQQQRPRISHSVYCNLHEAMKTPCLTLMSLILALAEWWKTWLHVNDDWIHMESIG